MSYLSQLLIYFFISHAISFLCSILEASLLSCTPSYIITFSKVNPPQGKILKKLKLNIDQPLAAILTFNTAAHTFGAAGVGATVEILYGDVYVTLASVIVTLTMLYFTEMIPKTIGALYWKTLIPVFLPVITFMMKVSYPFVVSFESVAKWISRGKKIEPLTQTEIKHLIDEGAETGIFENSEHKMVTRLFKIADSKAKDFMISRKEIPWIDRKAAEMKIREIISASPFSVYFIADNGNDNPAGFVYAADLLKQIVKEKCFDLDDIKRSPIYTPENTQILSLLETFNQKKEKVSFLVDEYGGISGIVMLEDILNEVVKDICSLSVDNALEIIKKGENSWVVGGAVSIHDLQEMMLLEDSEEVSKGGYNTLAGFCLNQLQSVPKTGEEFVYKEYRFKIMEMDHKRISKVLITRLGFD